jgi:hypothetical protein
MPFLSETMLTISEMAHALGEALIILSKAARMIN